MDIHWTVYDVAVKAQDSGCIIRFKEIGTQNKYVAHLSRKTAALLVEDLQRLLASPTTQANEDSKTGQENDGSRKG